MRFKVGYCYHNAWRWAEAIGQHRYKSLRIVHGYPTYPIEYGHAWVEWRGWCYDPALDAKARRAVYYACKQIDPTLCRYYTLSEAAKAILASHHTGPWEDERAGAWFKGRNGRNFQVA